MDSGLAVDDEKGSIVLVNAALCRMLGYDSKEDLLGRPITDMMYGWSRENVEEKMKARREGRVEHYDVDLIRKSGALVPAMVSASPLLDPAGRYLGSFAIFTDVSELKSAEEEARFLLDLLLHDVGNQLQLILAGADLLDNGPVTPEVENASRYVTEGANRCIELINKVRRAEEAKAEPLVTMDLMEVLESEIRLLSRQYHVEPEVGLLPEHLYVLADSSLNHLLWNLMENAVKHNPSLDKRLWIDGEFSGSTFELRIGDNGPGLSDSKKRQFFDPRRRYGGVGLHLVHRLADKYGAWVEAKDRVPGSPEQGLEVRVRFLVMSQ
jgi:PAS domain S-box-containing protein